MRYPSHFSLFNHLIPGDPVIRVPPLRHKSTTWTADVAIARRGGLRTLDGLAGLLGAAGHLHVQLRRRLGRPAAAGRAGRAGRGGGGTVVPGCPEVPRQSI